MNCSYNIHNIWMYRPIKQFEPEVWLAHKAAMQASAEFQKYDRSLPLNTPKCKLSRSVQLEHRRLQRASQRTIKAFNNELLLDLLGRNADLLKDI